MDWANVIFEEGFSLTENQGSSGHHLRDNNTFSREAVIAF